MPSGDWQALLAKIIVGFSTPKGFFKPYAWLIKKWQRVDFSHAYIRVPRASGVDVIYQASGHSINFMGLEVFKKNASIVKEFTFEISENSKSKFFDWAIKSSGLPYSVKKAIGIFLARCFGLKKNPFSSEEGSVCSILVGYALEEIIPGIGTDDPNILGPREIYGICEKWGSNGDNKI